MERPKDYYSLLGVPRDASPSAIRKAYRRLARRLGPDETRGLGSAAELRELRTALETLTDEDRRRRYDAAVSPVEARADALATWLREPRGDGLRRPIERGALTGEVLLSAEEAAAGGLLPLDVPLPTPCPACEGTGGPAFSCGACAGDGVVQRRLPVSLRVPRGVRDGALFQIALDEPIVTEVLISVVVRPA